MAVTVRIPTTLRPMSGGNKLVEVDAGALSDVISNLDAAQQFGQAETTTKIQECVAEKNAEESEDTAEEIETDCRDEVADDVRSESSIRGITAGFAFAGAIGFTIAIVYTSLFAMRTGLVSRFWGSLGMAMGAVFLLIPFFVFLWFIYLGFLLAGLVPGGRPPAWAAGEAIPWPDPRQAGRGADADDGVIDGTAEEVDGPDADPPEGDDSPPGAGGAPQIERRKRKKRNG